MLAETVDQVTGIASNANFMGVNVLGMKVVPWEDRGAVLHLIQSTLESGEVFVRHSWVCMRCGQFRDDVGIILDVADSDVLRVAVVPRFWSQPDRSLRKRVARRERPSGRPPQSLLTEEVARSIFNFNPQPGPTNDSFVFRGDVYLRNGLRIIEAYGIHAAIPVQPHAADVYYFTLLGYDTRYITNKSFIRYGDHIGGVSTEGLHVEGTVTYLSGDDVWITNDRDHRKGIKLRLADAHRHFSAGTTVVVWLGNETGRKGFVMAEGEDVLILLDERARGEVHMMLCRPYTY